MWQIWVDTGGTFTDCLAKSPTGEISRLKVLSSSNLRGSIVKQLNSYSIQCRFNWLSKNDIFENYQFRVLGSQSKYSIKSIELDSGTIHLKSAIEIKHNDIEFEITSEEEVPVLAARLITQTKLNDSFPELEMRLGSTRGTNALLERKGANVTFITTKGFKDLISIGDQQRPDLFALNVITPPPLYHTVLEVDERIDANGNIVNPLDEINLTSDLQQVEKGHSIAIALLNSYKNPIHEQNLAEKMRTLGFEHISYSSSLSKAIKILPRAETTIANSYLQPIIEGYINGIRNNIPNAKMKVMTSSGSVVDAQSFFPKDSLLSGPAGGIVGAASIGGRTGDNQLITFDMGGTSTDVAVYDRSYDYTFETRVGDARIQSPCLSIETIAAGGGSVCQFDGELLLVGPQSAGANPGPSCYGAGGPLTITDLNLLSGKLVPSAFSIPISHEKAKKQLEEIIDELSIKKQTKYTTEELIHSFLQIANEKMAEAIKKVSIQKGHNPADYSLISYGGAGGQHACALAELLNIEKIIVPYDAGLLSAYGISQADIEHFAEKQVLKALDNSTDSLPLWWDELLDEATSKMIQEGYKKEEIVLKKRFIYLRFKGQESTLEIEFNDDSNLKKDFQTAYQNLYGHWLESHQIEIESIRLIAAVKSQLSIEKKGSEHSYQPTTISYQKSFSNGNWKPTPIYIWEELLIGATIRGRAIIVSNNTTMYVDDGWEFVLNDYNDAHIVKFEETDQKDTLNSEEAEIELYKNRFTSIVEDMGALLQRTSFSVNVKERLDFSCTLLDEKATLIANAPHIPVHLGSMGICVRRVLENVNIKEGDVIITNHPAFGGSHLPDITLISGAFYQDELIGYVANRAHHSEVGGETPGSMPATATELEQEGVIISPEYLVKDGIAQWDRIKSLLTNARFPTRSLAENIADLEGALASINIGVINLKKLCDLYGSGKTKRYMTRLTEYVSDKLEERTINYSGKSFEAEEQLDDGSLLKTNIKFERDEIIFDFTGSSFIHSGNLNANEAIVQSVVLYVLRLLVNLDLPLNEGLMKNVKIINPKGLLNPDFSGENLPAVVGGNTEVSQRLTDTLLKALNLAACSQGTMNNLLFGNHEFGYYETICGGTGAGKGFNGHDAIHQHMTNTRITDPEILELRYPVRLNRFNIREESGGSGEFKGGNGVEREFLFLENLKVTLLTQHRIITPYGLKGGGNGEVGKQTLIKKNQLETSLASITSIEVNEGDRIVISTPGGGGYGKIKK